MLNVEKTMSLPTRERGLKLLTPLNGFNRD